MNSRSARVAESLCLPWSSRVCNCACAPRRSGRELSRGRCSSDLIGFAQALDEGAAQQKCSRELGILSHAAQFVEVPSADGRIAFRQQAFVADGLRLGVLYRDVPALALVAVEHVGVGFPAEDTHKLLRQIEGVMNS